jgi:hypothetical protein
MCRHFKSRQVIENEGKRKPRFSLFRGEKCHGRHFSRSPGVSGRTGAAQGAPPRVWRVQDKITVKRGK